MSSSDKAFLQLTYWVYTRGICAKCTLRLSSAEREWNTHAEVESDVDLGVDSDMKETGVDAVEAEEHNAEDM